MNATPPLDKNSILDDFLGPQGFLSKEIANYKPRDMQIKMAETIMQAIEKRESLIVEAGTGTGKTFAYLIPALLANAKVLISTGTKHLQDQLYEKDIPFIRKLINKPIKVSLLKGRANYVCLYRLEMTRQRGRFESKKQASQFGRIERFSRQDTTGDLTQLSGIDDSSLLSQVTSTADNCLYQECPFYEECFVFKARKKALEADVVVVNHHLLCADLSLKEEGFGELLPKVDIIIIDEAHQLTETARLFFSRQVSTRQLVDWITDLTQAIALEAPDFKAHKSYCEAIHTQLSALRNAFPKEGGRYAFSQFSHNTKLETHYQELYTTLEALAELMPLLGVRHQIFTKLLERLETFKEHWQTMLLTPKKEEEAIQWLEVYTTHLRFHSTPLNIATSFQKNQERLNASWIFTSATLTVNNRFDYFSEPLGLQNVPSLQLESPFDYRRIALLYHPENLPLPNSDLFLPKMIDASLPIIELAQGRTFMLFTSFRSLYEAAELLKPLEDKYQLFVQGDLPKIALIDAFRQAKQGILLGTMSFWEGVDVKGEALRAVIIEKLPFSSPNDPIEEAKIEHYTKEGKNAFIDYQLPQAVITLKQGVGRLIRDENDFGVLMIADSRLLSKSYGYAFIKSLPPMTKTQKLTRVRAFFDYNEKKPKKD